MDDHDEKNLSDQQIETNMQSAALLGDKESDKYVENKRQKKRASRQKILNKLKILKFVVRTITN